MRMAGRDGANAEDGRHRAAEDRDWVASELAWLKELAASFSLDELRRGDWLARLARFSLDQYESEVDARYFRAKYPRLTAEAMVSARIELAARYASIEGGLSAGAYTGAVAASIGSAGGASPLTLPAAGLSFVLDLLYLSHLQLRLAYDIAVINRVPLDLQHPEDLWKLIRIAFAVKGTEAGREAIGKGVPVLVRPIVQRIFSGSSTVAASSLPVLGRHLLQRNAIKFALPAVGVPLSMAVNYWSTRAAGLHAARLFAEEAKIVDTARRVVTSTSHHAELLWVLWMIVKADALIHENERLLLKHVTAMVSDLDSELAAISGLGDITDVNQEGVWTRLSEVSGERAPLYDAGVAAAAIDHRVNVNELEVLRRLAAHCSVPFDEGAVRRAARNG